jgi:2-C-methyl-D-erythritol 4-phosphate cytidylyltransferase / 2-C-methyl-D-erythritol 2,4-cyclodiphosphate synthase
MTSERDAPAVAVRVDGPAPATGLRADAIVVAAGRSVRMDGRDKLDALLAGRPLLARTLDAMAAAEAVERIVLVTTAERLATASDARWLPAKVAAVVAGGQRRQESVAAGLAALDALDAGAQPPSAGAAGGAGADVLRAGAVTGAATGADAGVGAALSPADRVVLVHDGARPLASPDLVERVAIAAALHGAAVPVLPLVETLKRLDGDRIAATIDRTSLATTQTPQGFRRGLLREALDRQSAGGALEWTDEAALFEACRIPVHVVQGEPANLKVTLPGDLARAAALVTARTPRRIGIGQDSHPFGAGSPLALGGVEIPGAPRLHGHSDGDAALHAVADALLGAAGLGDLGRVFPADTTTPAGADSSGLLAAVLERVRGAGYAPATVDLTIVAARPALAPHLDRMRDRIAGLLGLPSDAVNVKASTGNLDGMEGAGRGASVIAIAQLEALW